MAFAALLGLAGGALFPVSAQSAMADLRSSWSSVSANLIAAAKKLPEADYGFRPTPDVRSFGQLIGHVADAQFMFCGTLLPQNMPPASRGSAEKLTSKDDLLRALKDSVALCTAAADRVSDADATQLIKLFGRDRAKMSVLWANMVHSNEHYGNVVTYLRHKNVVPPSSEGPSARARVYYDQAHGELGPMPELAEIAGFQFAVESQPISAAALKNFRIAYLRTPSKEFSREEKDAIIAFVRGGGSLLLVLDEERRQPLAGTGVNDIIEPFGMKLTPDTPYLHNCGAIAKAGEIHKADREIPYSGGRAVEGGTPFAYQLDKDGKPGPVFAAWKKVEGGGGRVVVLGEGMATLFLGEKGAERMSGGNRDVQNTRYWGKDSAIFMEEVLNWLKTK